jgi:dipeptidyl aminopeptidase/acylaminoacyl peptidase
MKKIYLSIVTSLFAVNAVASSSFDPQKNILIVDSVSVANTTYNFPSITLTADQLGKASYESVFATTKLSNQYDPITGDLSLVTVKNLLDGSIYKNLKINIAGDSIIIPPVNIETAYKPQYAMPPNQPNELRIIATAETPVDLLSSSEVNKIRTLQSAQTSQIISDISPAGDVVLVNRPASGSNSVFMNMNTGAIIPTNAQLSVMTTGTQGVLRWVNNTDLVTWASGTTGQSTWVMLRISSINGQIQTTSLPLMSYETPVSISPDGSLLLITSTQSNAALMSTTTTVGAEDNSVTLTTANSNYSYYLFNVATGQRQFLMTLPAGTTIQTPAAIKAYKPADPYAWSSDGRKLGFVRTTLATGRNSLNDMIMQSALGRIPVSNNPFISSNAIEIFDIKTLTHKTLTPSYGDLAIYNSLSWSPDGTSFMAVTQAPAILAGRNNPAYFPSRFYTVAYRFFDENYNLINTLDNSSIGLWTEQPFYISPQTVVIPAIAGLSGTIYTYNWSQQLLGKITAKEGHYAFISGGSNGQKLVYSYDSFLDPPELYNINISNKATTALTSDNGSIKAINAVQFNTVTFPTNEGGVRSGYLIQPAGAAFPPNNAPIVVWQRGGPGSEMINQWFATAEKPFDLLPNMGISVLMLPLEMRPGWSINNWFALADSSNFGQIDIDEAAQVVRQMIAAGYTSQQRVGIAGCSYGGYFTSQSIIRHPGLYAAANPGCALLDPVFEFENTNGSPSVIAFLEGVTPFDDPLKYQQASPIYNASKIITPTLVFEGTDDFLPVNISVNFYSIIAQQGTPARMVQFDGEKHAQKIAKNVLYQAQEQINWFRTYLKAN